MASEPIPAPLQHLEPLVLIGPDGSLRIFDKSARVVCAVPANGLTAEGPAAEVARILSQAATSGRNPRIRLRIDVVSEAFAVDDLCRGLILLGELLKPHAFVQFVLHFADLPIRWSPVVSAVRQLQEALRGLKGWAVRAVGPFPVMSEQEMQSLFDLGIFVTLSAAWTRRCDCCGDVDRAALRAFSRFGFRVPVTWYVDANNIAEIENALPDILFSNHYGGFSLPLASCSPYYQFDNGCPCLPGAMDYCQLLVRAYKQYWHYDDGFSPLNELVLLVRGGGWHSEFDVPAVIRFLVGPDGQVSLYRQTPSLSVARLNIADVAGYQADVLRERFLGFIHAAWRWNDNLYCRDCCWRRICGGLDAPAPTHPGATTMDLMCEYRKLFLEHFALLRSPDAVIQCPSAVEPQ